jgi:hypothetical protein
VQVNRRGAALSTLSLTRPESSSQPARYTMLPTLDAVAASGVITAAGESKGTLSATVRPAVDQTQRVRLLLDSQTADPPVSVVVPIALGAVATTSVSASFDQVPSDDYRVTLEVDGVRSVPKLDANGHYILPAVAL